MILQEVAGDWHRSRFPEAIMQEVVMKTMEEVGEFASALLYMSESATIHGGDPLDEAADVVICLMVILERWVGGELMEAVGDKLGILNDPNSGHRSARLK